MQSRFREFSNQETTFCQLDLGDRLFKTLFSLSVENFNVDCCEFDVSQCAEFGNITKPSCHLKTSFSYCHRHCERYKQPVRTTNNVGDDFYRECDRKVCG